MRDKPNRDLYSMGAHHSKITKQELEAYKQLTFFTEKEILKCLDR